MDNTDIRGELKNIKQRLATLESELNKQLVEVSEKAKVWRDLDESMEKFIKDNTYMVRLNIGGRKFQTTVATLLSAKDTLFYKLAYSGKVDFKEEIFIDRDPEHFHFILSFLRNQKIVLVGISRSEISQIIEEIQYYGVKELQTLIQDLTKDVQFVRFTSSGTYVSGTITAGTNKVEDINDHEDKSLTKGIVTSYGGYITLEFDKEAEFDEIEIGGWNGNPNIFAVTNGQGSTIYTSKDNINWTVIGTIAYTFGNSIQKMKVTKTTGKYLKFQASGYLGLGYCKVII